MKQQSLALERPDAVYMPAAQWLWADSVHVARRARARRRRRRSRRRSASAIWSVDKDQPIVRVATMDALSRRRRRSGASRSSLFEAFALAALVLAAIGIYGVLSGSVTERMREIGVRAALGASRRDISRWSLRQGMALTALGVAIGLGGAVVASRALVTLLFGVSRLDPVDVRRRGRAARRRVAAWPAALPAWRAARVDPAITLRAE